MATVAIPVGAAAPLTVSTRLALSGYQIAVRGQVSLRRAGELAHVAAIANASSLDALSGGPVAVDLAAGGPWLAIRAGHSAGHPAVRPALHPGAGPVTGLFQAPDSAGFTHIVDAVKPGYATGAALVVSILFSLNLLLGVFNLLPIPPLDGFGAVGLLLPADTASRFQELGQRIGGLSMIGILLAWQVFDPIFDPVFTLALRALYPGMGYGS